MGAYYFFELCNPLSLQDQYIFIHDALLEAIECGMTEVTARDLPKHFKRMSSGGEFQQEFGRLSSTIHSRIAKSVYSLPTNRPKNRHTDSNLAPCKKKLAVHVRIALSHRFLSHSR